MMRNARARRGQGHCLLGQVIALLALAGLVMLSGCAGPSAAGQARMGAAASSPTSTRSATATPTRAQGGEEVPPSVRETVAWDVSHMTLDQKLGQLFLIETVWQGYNADVDNMVHGMHAGALIIYNQNISSEGQLRQYIATIQAHADLPMLTSTDEEGGVVDRLSAFYPPRPSAQSMAATGDPRQVEQTAAGIARDLHSIGFNTDLAPVVDVRTDPYAVEYTRLFGGDPATVDRYAGAFLQGLQENGIIGTLKHWPGIGSVTLDPHETLPTITRSRAELEATDFAAFRGLLAEHPGIIMVTHVMVPAIDPNMPATLSPKLVDGVLRGELGYQGVVMTDSLYMKGISLRYSLGEAAVLSVIAGDDLLEGAWDTGSMTEMENAIKSAIAQGRISEGRIDQSVSRILTLKALYGLLPLRDSRRTKGGRLPGSAPGTGTAPEAADVPRPSVLSALA